MITKKELNDAFKKEVIEIKDYCNGVNKENKNLEDRIACVEYIQMSINSLNEKISEYRKSEIIHKR